MTLMMVWRESKDVWQERIELRHKREQIRKVWWLERVGPALMKVSKHEMGRKIGYLGFSIDARQFGLQQTTDLIGVSL
jgi:hypothetical protein